jgi:hypothetical protein
MKSTSHHAPTTRDENRDRAQREPNSAPRIAKKVEFICILNLIDIENHYQLNCILFNP